MSTETVSLEDMLDGHEASAPVESAPPETGDKPSEAAPPAASEPSAETQADAGPMVPRKALEDERKKRQEFERKLQEFERNQQQPPPQQQRQQPQQPQARPDPFVDPDGYEAWVVTQAISRANEIAEMKIIDRELNRSERNARKTHGDEVVDAAVQAAIQTGLARKFIGEDDAFNAIVEWHGKYQLATNPQAALEKLEAEILAKHGITPNAQVAPPAKPKGPVPRSLASTASAQPRDKRGRFSDEPTPLENLLP